MKKAKLIKKEKLLEQQPTSVAAAPTSSVQSAVQVVRTWVSERRAAQQPARQMFAALFIQPQV